MPTAKDVSDRGLSDHDLQTFPNPQSRRDYIIHIKIPEFTCLCPLTGQPDFACLSIAYIPDQLCVELKSLKLYMHSYRNRGAFHEAVSNEIVDNLCQLLSPRFMRLQARFNARGGLHTGVVVEHRAPDWQPPKEISWDDIDAV